MIKHIFPHIRGLILDMDGVLWRDTEPIGDLPQIFEKIQQLGLRFTLATNNATRSAAQFVDKLHTFGVTIGEQHIVNSAHATAMYLRRKFPQGGPVFIVGEAGLCETLLDVGFYHANSDVLAVIAGLDRSINYQKLKQASLLIQSGALFIGTNPDPTYPSPEGLTPGAGTIISALETASGIKATLIGKPGPVLFELALERMGTTISETLAVGDRLSTDILGAQKLGMSTALVLSGVSSYAEAQKWSPPPDIVVDDLSTLLGN